MSSTILHQSDSLTSVGRHGSEGPAAAAGETKNPFLVALGERVRALRGRRGMTRKALALAADVSERHLANLEYGVGNASILVLLQVARALQCALAELIGDVTTSSPEWLMIREMLEQRDDATLRRVRVAVGELLGTGGANDSGRMLEVGVAVGDGVEFIVHANARTREVPEVTAMPRSIQEILDHADELAERFENCEPSDGDELPIEEYMLGRRRSTVLVASAGSSTR